MKVRYYVDPHTGLPHIYNHGIHELEVEEVLRSGDTVPGREGTRMSLGRTSEGRYLRVVFKKDDRADGSLFVITAYELTGKALRAYRRRRRRR